MKTNRIHAMMLMLGLAASISLAKAPSELCSSDCKMVFPGANSSEAVRTLASGVQWTEAWEHGSWGPAEEFLGFVFQKSSEHEGSAISVLVGMTSTGVISCVKVKGMDGIEEEFLAQFRAKTVRDNFDVAQTPEDLLFIPAKIKAMKTNPALSESIAQAVKEIALSASNVVE